jgi:Tfp pilus assembly protein PilF
VTTPNQHYTILMDAGLFELEQGNLAAATEHFKLAKYGQPKSVAPLVALAFVALTDGKQDEAMSYLGDACRLDPNDPLPRLALAELEALGDNYGNAAIGIDKILAGLPNDSAAILSKLQYRDCCGETVKAAEELAAFVRRLNLHGDIAKAAADLLRCCAMAEEADAMEAQA